MSLFGWFNKTSPSKPFTLPIDSSTNEAQIFQAVLLNSTVAIVITDPLQRDNPIIFATPAYQKMTGYSPAEVIGKNPRYLQGKLTDKAIKHKLHMAVEEGKSCRVELVNYKKDGTPFWNEVFIDPIRDTSGKIRYWMALKTDISERRNAEEALKKTLDELGNTNQDLANFAHTVSHDLKNPIGAIGGFGKILMGSYGSKLDEPAKELLKSMVDSTVRMRELVEDILQFSEVGRAVIQREVIDLSTQTKEISENIQKTDPERKVRWVLAENLFAQGDPIYLRILLENLLGNSWKYSFDLENAKTLFQPFHRFHSKAEFPGSGVGLSTVARVVEKHGGRIWAESRPNEGATFYFTIPAA
jgi:PAS domain S-box-containing protein